MKHVLNDSFEILDLVPSLIWPWLWTELNMEKITSQYLRLVLGSTYGKFWAKHATFEVSTVRNLNAPDFDFWSDLDLTRDIILFSKALWKRLVEIFQYRLVRLSTTIRFRDNTGGGGGRIRPPRRWWVQKQPRRWRVYQSGLLPQYGSTPALPILVRKCTVSFYKHSCRVCRNARRLLWSFFFFFFFDGRNCDNWSSLLPPLN